MAHLLIDGYSKALASRIVVTNVGGLLFPVHRHGLLVHFCICALTL